MPNIIECKQGSPEWRALRTGRITGSKLMDVMAFSSQKGKEHAELKKRADYRADIVAERLTGLAEDEGYVSPEMKWGVEHELEARFAYETVCDDLVIPVGFAIHPEMDFTGASPDALIGEGGILEIKCAKSTTHLGYLKAGVVPEEYRAQMTWEMVCCERTWGDFASYDPRMLDKDLRLFVVRYELDRDLARKIEAAVWVFNQEVEADIKSLKDRRWGISSGRKLDDQLRASLAVV